MSRSIQDISGSLRKAVRGMATSTSTLQYRLFAAACELGGGRNGDLPSDLRNRISSIYALFTKVPGATVEETYIANISKMSDGEAKNLIETVCDLCVDAHSFKKLTVKNRTR